MRSNLIQSDLKVNWHPCSQMKDYETFHPLEIVSAKGDYLHLSSGEKLIDAISSWWCKSLGHGHVELQQALYQQAEFLEHAIYANTTNETIVRLSEKLTSLMPHLRKVLYGGDGSSVIEMALKMSLHARQIRGEVHRTQYLTLRNAYHGDTLGAMSVSDCEIYKKPYQDLMFTAHCIEVPYLLTRFDDRWHDASTLWSEVEKQLQPYEQTATALIVEPILQGAGGMKLYSQDILRRLRRWADVNGVHLIADEIMTGFGRTGELFACEHAQVKPDFMCLSKGLTAGWLPFSTLMITDAIYDIFYHDYECGNNFLHSHTYSGNPLGAAVANATIDIILRERLWERAARLEKLMYELMLDISRKTKKLDNVRAMGAMVAADLRFPINGSRRGYQLFQEAVRLGALLRPLGDTVYWLPPLNCEEETLHQLYDITLKAVSALK